MRSKLTIPPTLQWLIFCGYLAFIVRLAIQDRLGEFVNPGYTVFILAMCAIGFFFAAMSLVVFIKNQLTHKKADRHPGQQHTHDDSPPFKILDVFVFLILISTALISTRPLLSQAAIQRADDNRGWPVAPDVAKDNPVNRQDYLDWSFRLEKDGGNYVGQEITLIGFVSPTYKQSSPNAFALTRFFVSCCAVDAFPLDVPVAYPNWQTEYSSDQWVKVTGKIIPMTVDGKQRYGIEATQIEKTDQPTNPYVFR